MTAYIFDPIFEDQLYQIVPYFRPETSRFSTDLEKGPGRRFSIRYGIIGRAARSETTAIILDAFDDASIRDDLILEWSMTRDQAAAAECKKSCLAVAVKDPDSGGLVGIVYADAEASEFFCKKADEATFIRSIEESAELSKFAKQLNDLLKLTCQVELKFNLVNIGRK